MDPMADIPTGRDDAPLLLQFGGPAEIDLNDVDGALFMLDRDYSGTFAFPFSKAMDPSVRGHVSLDGHEVGYVLKQMDFRMAKPWMLGVKFAGRLATHGTTHALRVEGFVDTDGNVMAPQDLAVSTRAPGTPDPRFAEHEQIARRVAEEGIVLLENRNGALPLSPGQLNVFGRGLHSFRTAIVGAGKINPRYTVGLREAIKENAGFSMNEELAEHFRTGSDAVPTAEVLERAKAASDTAIVVLSRASGENADNSSDEGEFQLTAAEDSLIETITSFFARTVVILNTPYPIDVRFVEHHSVDAVVLAAPGGMLGGPALLSVLDGSVNPSGRLTDTWSKSYADIPANRNFYDCAGGRPRYTADGEEVWIDTVYEEGIYVGYRYFATFGVDVAYPFGHGLSYTNFDIAPREFVVVPDLAGAPSLTGSVVVTNTGSVAGREVVQVYLTKPDGVLEQPALELVEFDKTQQLEPGASEELAVVVDPANWASWDEESAAYVAPAGEYVVRVGRSSDDTSEAARFILSAQVVIRQAEHRMAPVDPIRVLSHRDAEATYPRGESSGVQVGTTGISSPRAVPDPMSRESDAEPASTVAFSDVVSDPSLAHSFVNGLSVEHLARLAVCGQDGWGMEGTGVAGILAQPEGLDVPLFQVADGNSGVNVRTPNIGMPATVVLASTFDRDLARAVGRVIGEEAHAFDVDLILAPAMNLHRNPLNGRHPEYFSEDPVLTGMLAGAYAAGLESTGVGACYKHIAANNAESSRKRNQSIIPERALRELYLRPFEIAHRVHPAVSVMTAYNALNGVATSADPELIQGFLRTELGFDGFVMTDWSSNDSVDVVDMMRGGMNWITPGSGDDTFTRPLRDAIEDGRLPLNVLKESVEHLVRTVAELVAMRGSRQIESID
ncbi:glycoside hydrolase family 3 protein [Microbacterium phyllosphaerae]|uniref:glycoside hydrolase family 3 protein n=1 Tax=Microbacterium phyllosphaerae TaxID=124798 RepID=UPI000EA0BE51|nr:glycoside hydrolase family 3 protein [Microbacterium phyllosphaerae]